MSTVGLCYGLRKKSLGLERRACKEDRSREAERMRTATVKYPVDMQCEPREAEPQGRGGCRPAADPKLKTLWAARTVLQSFHGYTMNRSGLLMGPKPKDSEPNTL